MLALVTPSAPYPPSPIRPAAYPDLVPTRPAIDGIEERLRRLVDSSEPAVVFASLVRLCVPAFSDVCTVDIVEGARVRYRISFPPAVVGPASPLPCAERVVVTTFESDLTGWAGYTGVMTSLWHTRRSTAEDADRAAAIVDRAVEMIRSERLADPVRSRLAAPTRPARGGAGALTLVPPRSR